MERSSFLHFPVQFDLNGQLFHYHYIFETLAFIIGIRVYYYLRKRRIDPISDENRLWILLGAMLGALLGSRIIAVLENPAGFEEINFITLYASKTIAGGLVGGLLGVELIKKAVKVKIASGDLYVIPIIVAIFIGRIGCFLMGIAEPTFGVETNFIMGMDLGDGLIRHPVALYEMIYLVLMGVFFRLIRKVPLLNGDRFKLFMVLYFLYRFLVEFIKPYQALAFDLSIIHLCAIFIFLYYYKFLFRILRFAFAKRNTT